MDKKRELAGPGPEDRRSMASSQRGMGESSVTNLRLVSRKSMQNLTEPSFLVTRTMREPHSELDLRMMPLASISAQCASTMALPASPRREAA